MFTINYKGDICFPNLPLDLGFKYGKGMATVASNGGILLCGGESNFNGEVCSHNLLKKFTKLNNDTFLFTVVLFLVSSKSNLRTNQ